MVALVLCPGYHPPAFTAAFAQGLGLEPQGWLASPAPQLPPYSGAALCEFLRDRLGPPPQAPPLFLIAFSAGVVGAMTGRWLWQRQGGRVVALAALDGWGVPDLGLGPLHRLSHDWLTHWSSALLGPGGVSFWAAPAVAHADLWRSPQTVTGWCQERPGWRSPTTAAAFLRDRVTQYGGRF